MNPFAGTWVGRTKAECLNRFIVFGESHLRHILACWLTYYHQLRPHQGLGSVPIHQGLGSVPISSNLPLSEPIEGFRFEDIVCHESLGGLLKHYERRAA